MPDSRPSPGAGRPDQTAEMRSPMEAHGSYRGEDWSPERLMFHQNLETFADRVGLIVALQSNGKISQEQAYTQIRKIWKRLRRSKGELIDGQGEGNGNGSGDVRGSGESDPTD